MDALRTDINELPPRFYRVQPGRSRVALDELGFHSSSRASLDSEEQMIEAIQRRLDWENVQDSPFIPVFSDYQKAHTWALALTTLGVTDVRIAEINTSELVGAIMLSVKRAQHLLGPNIPADDRHDGEWLIMDCIPSAAIVQWIGSEEINQDFRRIWGSGGEFEAPKIVSGCCTNQYEQIMPRRSHYTRELIKLDGYMPGKVPAGSRIRGRGASIMSRMFSIDCLECQLADTPFAAQLVTIICGRGRRTFYDRAFRLPWWHSYSFINSLHYELQ